MSFTGNRQPILVRRVPGVAQDRQLEDVWRLQDGRIPRQGGAEGGLAQPQNALQNLAIDARTRLEQRSDANNPG